MLRLQKARHWAQGADQMQGLVLNDENGDIYEIFMKQLRQYYLEHYHRKDCRLVSPQMQMFDQMLGLFGVRV